MILTAIILAGGLSFAQPSTVLGDGVSRETWRRYEAYITCFARGVDARRSNPASPEANMREAKAGCRADYDALVASMVTDAGGDPAAAAARARAFLDEMDARAVAGPPAPPALAQLPVERLVGSWRMGSGALAVRMIVRFESDGSIVGILSPAQSFTANGLERWRIVGDGTRQAVLHASFMDGRVVRFERIPSFPGELNFINPADPAVQRIDLSIDDQNLRISLTRPEVGEGLRFVRDLGPEEGAVRD